MANPRLLIVNGLPMTAIVIVKAVGSPTPIELEAGDTARAYFVDKDTGAAIALPNSGGKDLMLGNTEQGEFQLQLTADETRLFPYDKGFKEDGSVAIDTCKCLIDFQVAKLPADSKALVYEVYVENMGL